MLKEHYTESLTLTGALEAAIAGLAAQANGDRVEITGGQLEVAVLDRTRDHRTFRRLTGADWRPCSPRSARRALLRRSRRPAAPSAPSKAKKGSATADGGTSQAKPAGAAGDQAKPDSPEPGGESAG